MVQRDTVYLHGSGRNHIRWFLLTDEVIQILDLHLFVTDDICCDVFTTVLIVESLYGSIFDTREFTDNSLHLFQLDTETTDLYLSVSTSHKLDIAIGQVTNDITGTVDTGVVSISIEGIRDEHLGGLFGTVEISTAHLRTTYPQLTTGADRQTVEVLIDNIQTKVVEGLTDGDILFVFTYPIVGGEDGALGGTIAIVHLIMLRRVQG